MREAAEQLYAKGLLLDPVGSGQVVGQEPGAGQSVPPGTTITIFLEPPLPENAA
jgi:beta-lactam-binding protein with PASTA domain